MSWLVAILYPVFVLIAFFAILDRRPASRSEAAIPFRDAAPSPDLAYAKRNISVGEAVKMGDFTSFPILSWPDSTVLMAISIEPARIDAGDVNGGKSARLCAGALSESISVQAVMCGPVMSACVAIAAVPAARLQSLGDALKAPPTRARLIRVDEKCS